MKDDGHQRRDRQGLPFTLAGARREVLELCPTERIKFQSLGLAILITSGIATISMWFALNSAMGLNAGIAVIAALVWGSVILGIDRWLVTSMPAEGRRRLVIALPRLVLALLLGSLISTPIVLRIFQSEIDAQIVVIKQVRAGEFLAIQQHSQVGKQVAYWTKDVKNLQKVIDSGGSVPLNPSADPLIRSLTKQRKAELKLEHQYYEQWQCQLYGGKGCVKKGNGPLAQASQKQYQQATAHVAKLTNQIQQRDKALSASDQASKKARFRQAKQALPSARQHLTAATTLEDQLQQRFNARDLTTNGLLIRLQALNQLSGKSFTINSARLLLFLLFLVIECLPVTVKLLQQPGNYERILQTVADKEFREARRALYRPASKASTAESDEQEGGASSADLLGIWRPTKDMTSKSPSAQAAQARRPSPMPVHENPTESEEFSHLDNRGLLEMDGIAVTADTDWNSGVDLDYGDDDL